MNNDWFTIKAVLLVCISVCQNLRTNSFGEKNSFHRRLCAKDKLWKINTGFVALIYLKGTRKKCNEQIKAKCISKKYSDMLGIKIK